jgi:acyl-CoA synthetase (AMP-forming)/AMP-acid ligase II
VLVKLGVVLTEAEVIAWCKEAVASFKKPKSVEFVAELPKATAARS